MNTFSRPPYRGPRRPFQKQQDDSHRVNHHIKAKEVRVVLEEGEQLGVMAIRQALQKAEELGLDLVEVAPTAKPPVCKIMDFGKFKYREQKKEAQAKKHRSEVNTKELRIRYRTDVGDLETKLKHAREFLEEGDKVKFSMRFKGREAMYLDLGQEKFDTIVQRLADIAVVEERNQMAGRLIYLVLAPSRGGKPAPAA